MTRADDHMELVKKAMLAFLEQLQEGKPLSLGDLALVNETKERVDKVKEDILNTIEVANEVHRICIKIQIKTIQLSQDQEREGDNG